ncbi:hypothetical protein BGW38_006343 [Lunasporangiospora selenospora]|uniref:4-amino-4-deoxychorismate lyase n=1 Tax=Lunasporangiospora selenospora TaxID=979761 RepID=A0A9P6FZJ2_9FUNG|nr:hypothetical protein BGW38_006343 [Lunasporangiospora selenospora]
MSNIQLLETILYDPKEGVFLGDFHWERMINSAKELAAFLASDQEKFLQDLIPTRSELAYKLEGAIRNAGIEKRQRLRVLLDFDGAVSIQSSHLPSEIGKLSDSTILVLLDTMPINKNNVFLHHKTTERETYNEARKRAGLGPPGGPAEPNVPYDVIMYNEDGEVTEGTIFNLAVELMNEDTGKLEWITPPESSGLLRGTYRRKLLEEGAIQEGVITLEDLKKAVMQDKRKIKLFNSVRKEFYVTLLQ